MDWEGSVSEEDFNDAPGSDGHLNIEMELEKFRTQWYDEISHQQQRRKNSEQKQVAPAGVSNVSSTDYNDNSSVVRHSADREIGCTEPSTEDQALYLYRQGVSAEQSGRLSDAIQYYRRAMQLVPDIENKVDGSCKKQAFSESYVEEDESVSDRGDKADTEDLSDLIEHFQKVRMYESDGLVCQAAVEQKSSHLSVLPVEVVTYILKWVISTDLDVHSLEQAAMVCRGFYLIARDEELWKLVCMRIWGKSCGRPGLFGTYRNMFIARPHLRFNGCYISKSTYFREGAKSLDNFYRPFHIVEYFRYIRFFPEGRVLMLTTPDNPYTTLPYLRSRTASVEGIMIGYYKMVGDRVTLRLKRQARKTENLPMMYRYRRSRAAQNNNNNDAEQNFEVELIVKSVGGKPHWQLVWSRYSMHTTYRLSREETGINFELANNSYPNLLFSRVRSFTAVAEKPLN